MFLDLHTHSTASDGTLKPAALVEHAAQRRLALLSLTDHDTVAGVAEAAQEAKRAGVPFIPGIELSAEHARPLHILGYFLQGLSSQFSERINGIQQKRHQRNLEILHRFRELGIAMTWEEVEAEAGGEIVGRLHFARVLLKKGLIKNMDEGFERFLRRGAQAYVHRNRLSPQRAIELIKGAGGIAVLAHPFSLGFEDAELFSFLEEQKGFGLGGVECFYSEHRPEMVEVYLGMAQKLGLMVLGGTDFHGENRPEWPLGIEMPDELVPEGFLAISRKNNA